MGGGGKLPNANCDQTTKWKITKHTNHKCLILGGGGVNYQMQIVTNLPNENNQNFQLEMFDSGGGGGGKSPNANCDQTTKWKITKHTNHKLPILRGGTSPNANCDQTTKWKISKTSN